MNKKRATKRLNSANEVSNISNKNNTSVIAPRTDTERQLTGIWGELLGCESVGVEDNFFELGGHSLLGIMLTARVQETFGVKPPLTAIFETPTISGFGECIDKLLASLDDHS